jgi:SAM-dependent methyltransferase
MNESSKSIRYFSELEKTILGGRVLDIGSGRDVVSPTATGFDLEDGDANHITKFPAESFDCVYSSHCLEHMREPASTLQNWWSLVKPNGYLFLIVPDEDLYEQGSFPSTFNEDHKHTFTIGKKNSWSAASINLFELCRSLDHASIESIVLNDAYYDRNLAWHGNKRKSVLRRALSRFYRSLHKRCLFPRSASMERFFARSVGWDQSGGPALSQIEVLVRKVPALA